MCGFNPCCVHPKVARRFRFERRGKPGAIDAAVVPTLARACASSRPDTGRRGLDERKTAELRFTNPGAARRRRKERPAPPPQVGTAPRPRPGESPTRERPPARNSRSPRGAITERRRVGPGAAIDPSATKAAQVAPTERLARHERATAARRAKERAPARDAKMAHLVARPGRVAKTAPEPPARRAATSLASPPARTLCRGRMAAEWRGA